MFEDEVLMKKGAGESAKESCDNNSQSLKTCTLYSFDETMQKSLYGDRSYDVYGIFYKNTKI